MGREWVLAIIDNQGGDILCICAVKFNWRIMKVRQATHFYQPYND
jgi:hypothetical protein